MEELIIKAYKSYEEDLKELNDLENTLREAKIQVDKYDTEIKLCQNCRTQTNMKDYALSDNEQCLNLNKDSIKKIPIQSNSGYNSPTPGIQIIKKNFPISTSVTIDLINGKSNINSSINSPHIKVNRKKSTDSNKSDSGYSKIKKNQK